MERQRCSTTVEARPRGGSTIPIGFDPVAAWGDRERYHVHGTIQGRGVRGAVTRAGDRWVMELGPSWCRDAAVAPGNTVEVVLAPEGPQVDDIPAELAALLRADDVARRAFEGLATSIARVSCNPSPTPSRKRPGRDVRSRSWPPWARGVARTDGATGAGHGLAGNLAAAAGVQEGRTASLEEFACAAEPRSSSPCCPC